MTANPLPPIPPISATTGMAPTLGANRFKPIDPLKVIRQYAWLLVAAGVVGIVLGGMLWVALRLWAPAYTSKAQLRVTPTAQTAWDVGGREFVNSGSDAKEAFMRTEAMVMVSDEVLRLAIEDPILRQTSWFGRQSDARSARESLRNNVLSVTPMRGSDVILLSASTRTPDDASRILSAVLNVYLRMLQTQAERDFSGVGSVYIQERTQAEERIRQINERMREFTSENKLSSLVANQSDANITYQQLANERVQLGLALDSAKDMLEGLKQKAEAGQTEASPEMLQEIERSPTVLQITYQINSLNQQIASLTAQYGARHRFTRSAEAQLEAAKQQKQNEIERLVRDAQVTQLEQAEKGVAALQAQMMAVQQKLDEASARMTDLNIKLAEYEQLKKDLESSEEQRDRADASIQAQRMLIQRPDAIPMQLQSSPSTAQLTFPRLLIVVPGITMLMLGLTAGGVFLRELLDQRVKSPADVKLLPDAELLGVLPDAAEDPSVTEGIENVVEKHPTGLMAESFRQVRTAILAKMDRRGYKTLMVVGGQPGAGASTIVQNLATSLAYNGRKVVLVDLNFRRPAQHKLMRVANDVGVIDVLREQATLESAVKRNEEIQISVLPSGQATEAAPEMFEASAFRAMLGQLESQYDIVLIDAPPALLTSESQLLAKHIDALAIVVRASTDKRGMVERMFRRLDGQRADVLGIILSGVRSSAGGYFRQNYRDFYRYRNNDSTQTQRVGSNGHTRGEAAGNGIARNDDARHAADPVEDNARHN